MNQKFDIILLGEVWDLLESNDEKSKDNNAKNVTIETILRVFKALKTKVNFNVELLDGEFKIA